MGEKSYTVYTVDGAAHDIPMPEGRQNQDVLDAALSGVSFNNTATGQYVFIPYHAIVRIEF